MERRVVGEDVDQPARELRMPKLLAALDLHVDDGRDPFRAGDDEQSALLVERNAP